MCTKILFARIDEPIRCMNPGWDVHGLAKDFEVAKTMSRRKELCPQYIWWGSHGVQVLVSKEPTVGSLRMPSPFCEELPEILPLDCTIGDYFSE